MEPLPPLLAGQGRSQEDAATVRMDPTKVARKTEDVTARLVLGLTSAAATALPEEGELDAQGRRSGLTMLALMLNAGLR